MQFEEIRPLINMDNENENLDSQNQENADDNLSDADALKEKNKQLFSRAKKAEGELKEFKDKFSIMEKEISELKEKPKTKKSDDFGLLEKAFLKASGIIDLEEIELVKKWHEDTKKPVDELVDHPFVKAELEQLRTAKANQTATSDIKGEGGSGGGAKDTPEYWIAKATINSEGKLAFPDDLPNDRKLRAKIADKLIQSQKEGGKKFYND